MSDDIADIAVRAATHSPRGGPAGPSPGPCPPDGSVPSRSRHPDRPCRSPLLLLFPSLLPFPLPLPFALPLPFP